MKASGTLESNAQSKLVKRFEGSASIAVLSSVQGTLPNSSTEHMVHRLRGAIFVTEHREKDEEKRVTSYELAVFSLPLSDILLI